MAGGSYADSTGVPRLLTKTHKSLSIRNFPSSHACCRNDLAGGIEINRAMDRLFREHIGTKRCCWLFEFTPIRRHPERNYFGMLTVFPISKVLINVTSYK